MASFRVIYKGKLYYVSDMTDSCYIVYDVKLGYTLYLPKEECEVV